MSLDAWAVSALLSVGFVTAGAVGQSWGPVSRARLARFASRHRLAITAHNGERVIRYLALTRRWRAAGLILGAVASALAAYGRDVLRIDLLALLAGWFVGALVAEVRLAAQNGALTGSARARPERRTASLRPRGHRDYLGPVPRLLLPAAVLVSTGTAAVTVVTGGGVGWRYVSAWLLGLAVAGAVGWVARRVLRRPQPLLPADELAADEAIRSRSLHVLYAAGATLVLYCVLAQLDVLRSLLAPDSSGYSTLQAIGAVGTVAVPLLGWLVATARWTVRAPSPVPVAA